MSSWSDQAEKDLLMALLTHTGAATARNWDPVAKIMQGLGHPYSKGAMSQRYSKIILKNFKERTKNGGGTPTGPDTPGTPRTPGAGRPKKTPATSANKNASAKGTPTPNRKRNFDDDDDDDEDDSLEDLKVNIKSPIATTKPARSVKKAKYAEPESSGASSEAVDDDDEVGDFNVKKEQNDEEGEEDVEDSVQISGSQDSANARLFQETDWAAGEV